MFKTSISLLLILNFLILNTSSSNVKCVYDCNSYYCGDNLECQSQLSHCEFNCGDEINEKQTLNCMKSCIKETYRKDDFRDAMAAVHCHPRCWGPPAIGYFTQIAVPSKEIFRKVPGWVPDENYRNPNWKLRWVFKYAQIEYNPLLDEGVQLGNKIQGFAELLGDKLGMMNTLQRYDVLRMHPSMKQSTTFWPETHIIDISASVTKQQEQFLNSEKDKRYWIIKTPSGYGGEGLIIIEKKEKIQLIIDRVREQSRGMLLKDNSLLIQQYIERPLLLNKKKFDIRAFMLIASTKPFLVLFHTGYVRRTLVDYNLDISPWNREQQIVHLTNTHMQERHPNWEQIRQDHSFTFQELENFLMKEYGQTQEDLNIHWNQMKQILCYAFLASQNYLERRKGGFHLTGNDFMMDEDFQLFILELNQNPRLQLQHNGERNTVPKIVKDVIDFVFILNDRQKDLPELLQEPTKHFDFKDWEILYNQASNYNYIDDPKNNY